MKLFRIFIILFIFMCSLNTRVHAENPDIISEIYESQFKLSGAEKIRDILPKESEKHLNNMGIHEGKWKEFIDLNPQKIFTEIIKMIQEKMHLPFKSFIPVLSVMLMCSLVKNIYPSINNNNISQTLNSISTLCVCICIIKPLMNCILSATIVIRSASNFILFCVPITVSIMIASGKPLSAASYNAFVILAGEFIGYISENFIIPFMNILLGISLIASFSSSIRLNTICSTVHKLLKTILEFSSATFIGMFTLQHVVASSGDNLYSSALKFAINGCVPIVGGIISDSLSTVTGCIKLLKSGIGAFGILAGIIIFLPAFIECFLWISFTGISKCLSDVLEFKKISCLLNSVYKIVSVMIALLSFSMIILIISSVLMLILGGN